MNHESGVALAVACDIISDILLRDMIARILTMLLMGQMFAFSDDGLPDADSRAAMELEEAADMAIYFDPVVKTINLGITRIDPKDGSRRTVRFKLADLIGFFDSQRHRRHIVVIFEKRRISLPELTRTLDILKKYFLDRGYDRVTIQQNFAFGRGSYLDHKRAEGTDQPATADDSMAEGNEKAKSESEGRPQ